MPESVTDLAKKLVTSLHRLGADKSISQDSHGNVSVRVDDGKSFLIKPSGVPFHRISISDIPRLDLETLESWDRIYGGVACLKPSVDSSEHAKIYKKNPWVNSICHTHSPFATAVASAVPHNHRAIPVFCTEMADYFGMPIRISPYASFEWGEISLQEDEKAILLDSHGVLTCSRSSDPSEAVKLAHAVEMVAQKFTYFISLGGSRHQTLGPEESQKWNDRYQNRYGQ